MLSGDLGSTVTIIIRSENQSLGCPHAVLPEGALGTQGGFSQLVETRIIRNNFNTCLSALKPTHYKLFLQKKPIMLF